MLISYNAHIPECEDMFSVKHSTTALTQCHKSWFSKSNFSSNKTAKENLCGMSWNAHQSENGSEGFLQQNGRIPMIPVLQKCPFFRIHSSVDIFAIFRFQPLHFLASEVSKTLKECMFGYFQIQTGLGQIWDINPESPHRFRIYAVQIFYFLMSV